MSYETIDLQIADGVAWIALNRPEALNALDLQMAKELFAVSTDISRDPSVRAVRAHRSRQQGVLRRRRCGGFRFRPRPRRPAGPQMTTHLHAAVSRFAAMDAPLIAAVNGVAAGGGLSLVACCDLAISADHARYTSAYTPIGLSPDGSSTCYLSRLLGKRRATELYLTNRVLSAAEALDWGLVNRVVPAASLLDEVGGLAARLPTGRRGPTAASSD